MKTRIGFSRSKGLSGLTSRIIMFFSGARVSHAWLLYYDHDFECEMVLEAHETGFRLVPFKFFRKTKDVVVVFTPKESIDGGLIAARDLIGERYDFEGLFGMFFVMVARWVKVKIRNPFRSRKAQFCAEAVVRVLQVAQYPGSEDLDPDSTTPGDLVAFFRADGSPEWKMVD